MKSQLILRVLFFMLTSHIPLSIAQANAWTGTWHLNETRSQPLGPSFTEVVTSQGEYQMNNGRFTYHFRCDGKEYPAGADRTIVCTHGTPSSTDTVLKIDGKIVNENHNEVSPDNKQLIVTSRPPGSNTTRTHTFQRVSGSTGLSGAWLDVDDTFRTPRVIITTLSNSVFRLELPLVKQSTEMNLDGADAPTLGTSKDERVTLSAKPDGQSTIVLMQKIDGVPVSESSLTLSADGRILIHESWRPGHPNEKLRLVYDKQ